MQNLDVISVNLWQILISLANLAILFLLVKKLFYKPVKKVLEKREEEINVHYSAAKQAESEAIDSKNKYESALSGAKAEADEIIKDALGEHIYEEFVSAKEKECDKFRTYVTPLEVDMYLNMQ